MKKNIRHSADGESTASPSRLIAGKISELGDWRGKMLERVRALIKQADPDVVEEWKWRGVPVWEHDGIICTGETYRSVVKLTFAKGASLEDPAGLFNSSLEGNTRRAIDIREGQKIDTRALKALVRAAVALNTSKKPVKGARTSPDRTSPDRTSPDRKTSDRKTSDRKTSDRKTSDRKTSDRKTSDRKTADRKAADRKAASKKGASKPVLLSGGNPQIAKADGDAPVQQYIAAMPGWKKDVGRQLDLIITRTVPDVQKAVRWNTPFYGVEGKGWFLGFHCMTKYIKVAFPKGASLRPPPPVESKQQDVRYFHIHENDPIDEKRVAGWIRQASRLPGEQLF